MRINGIGASNAPETPKSNDFLNVNDFLKIMTAQLQHLDPMGENSNNSGEYITQMAQFTMLEQMSNLVGSMNQLSMLSQQQMSFSLVGKTVTLFDGQETMTGVVDSVRYREGQAYPVIHGVEYPMGMVVEVREG